LPGPAPDAILARMMTQAYDRVFVSPHLDDAVLSCGGTIHQLAARGERILVVSVFAGSPDHDSDTAFSRELKERWGGAEDPVGERRDEDLAATRRLGARALHLNFLDCVYRHDARSGKPLYPTVERIFGDVHAAEQDYHQELARALRRILSDAAITYVPLTAGHHVDHILTWRAVMSLADQTHQIAFYEDYPYAEQPETVQSALASLGKYAWRREPVTLDHADVMAKVESVACYRSQISTFWSSLDEMRSALERYARSADETRHVETYWRIAAEQWPQKRSDP